MKVVDNIAYPFDYTELGPKETEEFKNCYTHLFTSFIRLGPNGYFFYKEFDSTVLDIYTMEVRTSDTFVLSFPRSGTTWTQDLVWLLENDCDFEKAKTVPLPMRFPFMESGGFLKLKMLEAIKLRKFFAQNVSVDSKLLSSLKSPRFLKSHLPLSLLPPSLLNTAKVVYVARDPRDVAVSNFFHAKSFFVIRQDVEFKLYWNLFLQNKVLWSPYFEHVKEAWNQRNHPNMSFIFYEELSEDLLGVARRLGNFFGKKYSEEQYQSMCNYLKFDNFKNNDSVNRKDWQYTDLMSVYFIRQGKPGGWREHFDAEMTQQAERWIADNLRDTDLRFPSLFNNSIMS